MADPLLSDSPAVLAQALRSAIDADATSEEKKAAETGVRYYRGEHDILGHRIFYFDDTGHLREDKTATNVRIPHPFMTELVDQKVSYLLSCPVEALCDDDAMAERLAEYYDEDFQVFLQELVAGASKKGAEYAFARTGTDDRLRFQVSDYVKTFTVYDETYTTPRRVVRYYVLTRYDRDRRPVEVTRAEVWDEEKVWFFTAEPNKPFVPDPDDPQAGKPNPRPHVMAATDAGEYAGRDYGFIPFYRLKNNDDGLTDLEPVKGIIDDYDMMNAYLTNNLQDFTDAIYVVKGYAGQDLTVLRDNIRAKKAVSVSETGDVDIRTIEVPVEGRRTKMAIDKENVYIFGQGFDSSMVGDGNITNVVIKSRYSRLDLKCNRVETRLRAALQWINDLVVADINRRYGTTYDPSLVEFTITRTTPVNENDQAAAELTGAQATAVQVNTVLAVAPRVDDETTLRLLCDLLDLDYDEVQARVDADAVDTTPLPTAGPTDPTSPATGAGMPPQVDATPGSVDSVAEAQVLKAQADAMGVMVRAGADPDEAAQRAGLGELSFVGQPVAVRSVAQAEAQTVEAVAQAEQAAEQADVTMPPVSGDGQPA